jgi:hypothetical protein
MKSVKTTAHAIVRLAQRAIRPDDVDLALAIGTLVEDGVLVTRKDCEEFEHYLKRLADQVRRLSGKRLVLASDRIVTGYHASPRQQQRLLRPR